MMADDRRPGAAQRYLDENMLPPQHEPWDPRRWIPAVGSVLADRASDLWDTAKMVSAGEMPESVEEQIYRAGIGLTPVLVGSSFAPKGSIGAGPTRPVFQRAEMESAAPAKLSRPRGREAVKSGRGSEEAMFEGAKAGSHLKRKSDGKYVGAPESVTSPAALAAMRRKLDRLVDDGEIGADWYSKGRNAVREMTGDDPRANAITANTLGITSPLSTPTTNLGTTLRGLTHHAVTGEVPPIVRTGAQADAIRDQILTGGGSTKGLGKKTRVFADTLNPDKEGMFHGSTNDIWHARGFGYANSDGSPYSGTPSAQMHAFMDNETALGALRAKGRGIEGDIPSIQARIWVAKKIEDAMAGGLSRDEAIKKVMDQGGSFADYLDKHTLYGTHEFLPGGATGHLKGMEGMRDALDAFYAHPATTWATAPGGRDSIYASMDLMPVRPTSKMQGAWKDDVKGFQSNPGEVARPMVPLVAGPGETHRIDPAIRPTAEAAEVLRAYLSAQSGAGAHRIGVGQAGQRDAVNVPMDRPLTHKEVLDLADRVSKRGYDVSDRGSGATITQFYPGKSGQEVKTDYPGILGDIRSSLPDAGPAERVNIEKIYHDIPFDTPGSGEATRYLLDAMGKAPETARTSMGTDPLVRQQAGSMARRDAALGKAYDLPVREDIQRARSIFERGGLPALRKAVEDGAVLPAAAAIAVTGIAAGGGGNGRQE